MGRSSRREVRHDLLRGVRGRVDSGCQRAEGRLSLRRPAGGLLPGGYQSTPLSRRPTRRPRPQEEARRRAEARLASLFRVDGSPGRPRNSQLGCVGVADGSDTDASVTVPVPATAERRPAKRAGSHGRPASRTASRVPSVASGSGSAQSAGREDHRCRSAAHSNSQRRSVVRENSPCRSAAEAGARCLSATVSHPWSDRRPSAAAACADWTCRPRSAVRPPPTSPDEGEGLTPGPGAGVRIEDLLDTVLGEVRAQLDQLTAGSALACNEDRAELVALYRRQPPPPAGVDCPLLQRLRGGSGGRGDADPGRADTQDDGGDAEDDFVLQVCTSSQEDSALEQDPIRFLKMAEAAGGGSGSVSGSAGTGWLDAPPPPARGGPLRQRDLLTARTGALRRSPSPPPPPPTDVGWLEAAVAPASWPDWRGGGDILDVLDGPRPPWEAGRPAASAAAHHRC